ncbi:hypothetical protein HAZT_HAZT004351 [Hyalella azteca]|uniref:Uncharacterized protein n=1 Tax=Hyalella azteca TaxID=294128 RepID=A0A6A0HBU4_HYAAZ|nr:hypothetical protein HAZT_HAZT004351 [Hyalella azteca]
MRYALASIDCFKCVSVNGENRACEDPFHNNYSTSILESPCMAGRKNREGLFPATACIKLAGEYGLMCGVNTVSLHWGGVDVGVNTMSQHWGGFDVGVNTVSQHWGGFDVRVNTVSRWGEGRRGKYGEPTLGWFDVWNK